MNDKVEVPFVDLAREFSKFEDEFVEIFKQIGRSGSYVLGQEVEQFEKAAANFCGTNYALGVANGTDALILALRGLGVGPGDEVITVPNTFIASVGAIAAVGATIRLVDVGNDLNMDPTKLDSAITKNTKAIMPVHLTGRPVDMDPIIGIAKAHGAFIIEDAAQAIGARYKGNIVGGIGDVGCFSLHPLKNLGVYGDGGFITTNNPTIFEEIKLLRNHGLSDRNTCEIWGFNSRLDNLQAAIGLHKLQSIDERNQKFRKIATQYWENLNDVVLAPKDNLNEYSVYHNYVIQVQNRKNLMNFLLKSFGVQTAIHYPILLHMQPAGRPMGYAKGSFPNAERLVEQMVSLPIFPELLPNEISRVIEGIRDFYNA